MADLLVSSKSVNLQCLADVKADPESAAAVIMQQSDEIERLRNRDKTFEAILVRVEATRQRCLLYGNFHPKSNLSCHEALTKTNLPPIAIVLGMLIDDMALAMRGAPETEG